LLDGNYYTSYVQFNNYNSLYNAGVLPGLLNNEYGDLPFHFVAYLDNIETERKINMTVSIEGTTYSIEDNSLSSDINDYQGTIDINNEKGGK
jgi:hypothetical protein